MELKEWQNLFDKGADISRERMNWACDNANRTIANTSNFLTTLAGVSLGLSPLIFPLLNKASNCLKIIFVIALALIFFSLLFGAIYILFEKSFFDQWQKNYAEILGKWDTILNDKGDALQKCNQAQSFEYGILTACDMNSREWPLIMQEILLFLGFLLLLIIISIGIFL